MTTVNVEAEEDKTFLKLFRKHLSIQLMTILFCFSANPNRHLDLKLLCLCFLFLLICFQLLCFLYFWNYYNFFRLIICQNFLLDHGYYNNSSQILRKRSDFQTFTIFESSMALGFTRPRIFFSRQLFRFFPSFAYDVYVITFRRNILFTSHFLLFNLIQA